MWPFTAAHRPFLDADEEAWQIETRGCFLENFGGTADLKQSPLVTPTRWTNCTDLTAARLARSVDSWPAPPSRYPSTGATTLRWASSCARSTEVMRRAAHAS